MSFNNRTSVRAQFEVPEIVVKQKENAPYFMKYSLLDLTALKTRKIGLTFGKSV